MHLAALAGMKTGEKGPHFSDRHIGQKMDDKGTPAGTVRSGEEPNGKCAIARPDINLQLN